MVGRETSAEEFSNIHERAFQLGFYVGRHINFDPCRAGGDLYVMPRATFKGEKCPTLVKYATVDEVWDFILGESDEKLRA